MWSQLPILLGHEFTHSIEATSRDTSFVVVCAISSAWGHGLDRLCYMIALR